MTQLRAAASPARPRRTGLATWPGRRPWVPPALVCALACTGALLAPMVGTDAPAHEFRTWLFRTYGPRLWDGQWYGGHLLPGYGLAFPALASVVGTRLLGALACTWAAAAGGALIATPGTAGRPMAERVAGIWFALACAGLFLQGQYPFALGLALSLTALLTLRLAARLAGRGAAGAGAATGVTALGAGLVSPLAGAFLLLVGLATADRARWRAAVPLGAAAVGVVLGSLLGDGGSFPFPAVSLFTVLGFCALGLMIVRGRGAGHPLLRRALLLYAVTALVIFAVPNPVGGNLARLGALAAGPLTVLVLGRQGRRGLAAIAAVPLLVWQAWPAGAAVAHAVGDPSARPEYYAGLQAWLRTQDPARGRLEIPALRSHWEADYVAPTFPLARGWERQVDLRRNAVLYGPALTTDQLHAWALDAGVGLIALSDAPLDPWSRREAALVTMNVSWLTPVWHDAHWRVWRVSDGTGLVSGPAHLQALGIDTVDLAATGPGEVVARVNWSPFWQVMSGLACVAPTSGDQLGVRVGAPGPVHLAARWSLGAMRGTSLSACPTSH